MAVMNGVSVTEALRLKRGSVRCASAPWTAHVGNSDVSSGLGRLSPWDLTLHPWLRGQGGPGSRKSREAIRKGRISSWSKTSF